MVLFFSSRGADAGVIPKSEGSKATIIKSKWYGKQRSATAPPPPLNLSRSQPTSTQLDTALLSPSQPPPSGRLSNSVNPKSPKPRQSTSSSRQPTTPAPQRSDPITMSLAARLNELEASNTDGLLDDEGYRLLRQNLFSSFASSSSPPPPEAPPLRLAGPSRIRDSKAIPKSSTDPNFRISKKEGTESIRSNRSRSSTVSTVVSNIFKRGAGGGGSGHAVSTSGSVSGYAGRPSTSSQSPADADMNDAISVFSDGSRPSMTQLRRNPSLSYALSHGSSGSINGGGSSDHNSSQHDLLSISSRRTGWSALTGTSLPRTPSRAMRQPPSAYHLRNMILASSSTTSIGSEDGAEDGGDLRQGSAELRAEIASVEAEYKRIVDNYAGAEMAAVVKRQHHGGGTINLQPVTPTSVTDSSWTMVPSVNGDAMMSKPNGLEKDGSGGRKMVFSRSSVLMNTLRRKPSNASSSRTSSSQTQVSLSPNSASPALLRPHNLPGQQHHLAGPHYHLTKSSSSLSLRTSSQSTNGTSISNHPLRDQPSRSLMGGSMSERTLSVSDGGLGSAGMSGTDMDVDVIDEADVTEVKKAKIQLEKIRNSRNEAIKRYEERLELLRVKLKSAEIHEKLMKK